MSNSPFAWKNLNRQQRGAWVRQSLKDCLYNKEELRKLFRLTENGVDRILAGSDWQPSFQESEPAPTQLISS